MPNINTLSTSLTFNGTHNGVAMMLLNTLLLKSNIYAVFQKEEVYIYTSQDGTVVNTGKTFFEFLQDLLYGPIGSRVIDPNTGKLKPIEANIDDVLFHIRSKELNPNNIVYMKKVTFKKVVEEVPYIAGKMRIGTPPEVPDGYIYYDIRVFSSDLPLDNSQSDVTDVNLFKYYKYLNFDQTMNPVEFQEWLIETRPQSILLQFGLDYFGDSQIDGSQNYTYNLIQLVVDPMYKSNYLLLTDNRYNKDFFQNNLIHPGYLTYTLVQKPIQRDFEQSEVYTTIINVKLNEV